MRRYRVKEIFHTIQGEGMNLGTPAVFVRFSGCNLWSGLEKDRETAICRFCDTDFRGGVWLLETELLLEISKYEAPLVVFTGGEPGLQLTESLVAEVRALGFRVAVESNGTVPLPAVDWLCISPKAGTTVVVGQADELKLVYPQEGLPPLLAAANVSASYYWLSPMDGPNWKQNVGKAVEFVKAHKGWGLNIQAHKVWEIA